MAHQKHTAPLLDKYQSWSQRTKTVYEPWLKVYDVSSRGVSSIILGSTTHRNHHFLSLLELSAFLILDWNLDVEDIKEQFALDPLITSQLAKEAGIKHPAVGGKLTVMTSDLVIDLISRKTPVAIQVKPSKELEDYRVVEKLELERRYWARKNVLFIVITEKEIPSAVADNVRWLQPMLHEAVNTNELERKLGLYLHVASSAAPAMPIRLLSQEIDNAYELNLGESLRDIKQLIAHRLISVDLAIPFHELTVQSILNGSTSSKRGSYAAIP